MEQRRGWRCSDQGRLGKRRMAGMLAVVTDPLLLSPGTRTAYGAGYPRGTELLLLDNKRGCEEQAQIGHIETLPSAGQGVRAGTLQG